MLPAPRISRSDSAIWKPAPELRGVEDRLEPLARLVRQPLPAAVQQVRVGPPRRAADPAAELVELRQPERVRAVDDDRVGVGDVQPGFDDRRADEDVGGSVGEGDHHLLERALGHLAVADDEADAGQHRAELLGLRLDRLDPVVDVEDLAAPIELAEDRVADETRGRLGDPRLDRQPVLGRRLDDGQVADPGQGQVERPRDRRGRQRQDVDLAAELLEPLLGGHPEPLLLVDHDEAEVLEPDVLAEQPVRADDDVDRPVGQARRWWPPGSPRGRTATAAGPRAGTRRSAGVNVAWCWAARTVVGTRIATWRPSWVALNAARSATSVLP